jgi:hypothetical protein
MSSAVCKRSSLIAIVNRLYLNANNDQIGDDTVIGLQKEEESEEIENQTTSEVTSREASESPKNGNIKTVSPNLSQPTIIPLSSEIATNGFSAIGGCRQCSRTFNDRLSLIHHFIDHFPTIFYSFESFSSTSSTTNSSSGMLIPIMPSATTSSALGISTSNVSQSVTQNSSTKNNFGQQQQNAYASGIQSMMFFPYISMNNHQQSNSQHQPHQHQTQKIKEGSESAKKKKDNKQKNSHANESIKETSSSRFTDFNKTSNDLPYDMCPHCCQTFSDHSIYSEHLKSHDTPVSIIQQL